MIVRITASGANEGTRRQFVDAEASAPGAVASALSYVGRLYTVEVEIEAKQPSGENKRTQGVFDVELDTNHLERPLRPIPMGRRNGLYCWTEIGAAHVGIIQSLICTCKLHEVAPYTYLVGVFQRVNLHPTSDVDFLTPN